MTITDIPKRCGTCIFTKNILLALHCHRFPPTASMIAFERAKFPIVRETDFCGEWKGKAEEPNATK